MHRRQGGGGMVCDLLLPCSHDFPLYESERAKQREGGGESQVWKTRGHLNNDELK